MAQSSRTYSAFVLGTIDAKRRLVIPATIRAVIETKCPKDNSVHLKVDGDHGCLLGYDSDYVAKRSAAFEQLEARWIDEDHRDRRRLLKEWAQLQCFGFDSSGRLGLPDFFADEAGLKDVALYAGAHSHFEIWSPDRFLESNPEPIERRWVESLLKGRK